MRQKHQRWHTFTNIRGHDGGATSGGKAEISVYTLSPDEDGTKLHFITLKAEVTQRKILTFTHHHVSDGQSHKLTQLEIRKRHFCGPDLKTAQT